MLAMFFFLSFPLPFHRATLSQWQKQKSGVVAHPPVPIAVSVMQIQCQDEYSNPTADRSRPLNLSCTEMLVTTTFRPFWGPRKPLGTEIGNDRILVSQTTRRVCHTHELRVTCRDVGKEEGACGWAKQKHLLWNFVCARSPP